MNAPEGDAFRGVFRSCPVGQGRNGHFKLAYQTSFLNSS